MSKLFSFELSYVLYGSPEKVFDALTKSSTIKKWSEAKSNIELKPNGVFEIFDGWAQGNVISFERAKSFSFTWKVTEWDKKDLPSSVEIVLQKNEAGSKILLRHTKIPNQSEADKHKQGWIAYVFDPINDYFISEMEKQAGK
jgi:uncharacterized protein YndB with AHSA1/START domain